MKWSCFSEQVCKANHCRVIDGAYDGERICDLLAKRFGSKIEVTIPPPRNAALSPNAAQHPTVRGHQIVEIQAHGRMAWQKTSGYNQRSRGETLMGRWKAVIGPKLKARTFENQKTEAKIGVRVLNRMTGLGVVVPLIMTLKHIWDAFGVIARFVR